MTPRNLFKTTLFVSFVAAALGAASGCGSTVAQCTGAHCGVGGEPGSGGGATCTLDPPGTSFTFHIHNGGTKMLQLAYGCSHTIPVDLDTPLGTLSIGPGEANSCEITCESVYAGHPDNGCSDCGPGVGAALAPGATVDLPWDRRVYVAHVADPQCSGSQSGNDCALGQTVAGVAAQMGVLTACTDDSTGPDGPTGYCTTTGAYPVSFTVDTTKTEGTIEVQ